MIAAPLLGAVSIAACSSSKAPAPPESDVLLQQSMDSFVHEVGGPPGIAVAIANGGKVSFRSAGVANVATGARPSAASHMRLASVAKAFSGAAAVSLVAQGRLALDDTIAKWLPGLPAAWSPVTVGQLLAHTSGISDFSKSPDFTDAVRASLLKAPPPRTLVKYASSKLLFAPGSKYAYSNTDNILVALIVEAATHRSYESVLQSNVYKPLGLTQTSLPSGPELESPSMHGYGVDPPNAPEDVTSALAAGWSWASGGVVSTPSDAVRFVQGYVRGALTNSATRSAQFTFRAGSSEPPGPGTNSAGLAVFRYETSCGTVYGHTGNTAGYTQFVAATADGSRGVAVSINAQITPKGSPDRFADLRHIYELAVCAAK
jgi:D-alanyl-D-alanine carboxypeptidase